MHSSAPCLPRRSAAPLLLALMAAANTSHAVDFYKANNSTAMNAAGSWTDLAGTASATAPGTSTNSTDFLIWDNRFLAATAAVNVPVGNDIGIGTIKVLDPGGPVTIDGGGNRSLTIGNGGGVDMSLATQDLTINNLATASNAVGFRIGASAYTIALNVPTGRTLTINSTIAVRSSGSSVTVNFPGTGNVILGGEFRPTTANITGGVVQFNRAAGSSRINNASGFNFTNIGGGASTATVLVNNTSGSATGSGTVALLDKGVLGGNGIITGTVTTTANTVISPGLTASASAVGSLKIASLALETGSKIVWEATNTAEADLLTTTTALTLNGGTISLYNPGTTAPLSALGTFTLINYGTSTITGAVTNLAIDPLTKIDGRIYTLANSGTAITLTIATEAAIERSWDVDSSGTWSTAANWTADTIPDAIGTIANITGVAGATFSAPRTITLDAPRTVGTLALASAQPVTLAGAAALTLDNNAATALLNSSGANHLVSTPLALTAGGVLTDVAASTTLTLGGEISGTGFGVSKTGSGTLLLTANNTYTGATSVSGGTLQIGNGGTTGLVGGNIANNGVLRVNRSDSIALPGVISGIGSIQFVGLGDTTLSGANTYSGGTTLSAGTLIVGNANALQNSTLTYSTSGGSLTVADPVAALTLGGLAGDRALPLTNTLGTPLALTVGQNNSTNAYSGSPSGNGASFTKAGTGALTLTGTHVYSGATTISNGTLELGTGAVFTTTAATLGTGSAARLLVSGGTLNASAASLLTNASIGFEVTGGVANFNGGITTETSQSASEPFINVTGGALNASAITISRGSLNIGSEPASGQTTQGLYINGGSVHVTGALGIGSTSGANSSVSARMDSGSLTVDGALTVGINNTTRWSVLDINGGTLTVNDATSGLVLGSAFAGEVVMHVRGSSAVVKVPRIQFGQEPLAGKSYLNIGSGSGGNGALYVGSGGLVVGSTSVDFLSELRLYSGTLGATADWSSSIPMALNGDISLTGADDLDVAHTITLSGKASGIGAIHKRGSGRVSLTATTNDYAGPTTIEAGRLDLAGKTTFPVTVNSGATFSPLGEFNADFGATINGNLALGYDAAAAVPVSRLVSTSDVITLGASATLAMSGTGTLTAPAYVLVKSGVGITGTFAIVTGKPSGYNIDYAFDDDADTNTPPVIALVAAPASPYDTWAASYPALTDKLPGSDPDGDGLTNLQEYAFATSPVASDRADAYAFGRTGNNLTISFDHPADSSITYAVEASDNLAAAGGGWTVVNTFAPFTVAGTASYTDTANLAVTPRRFLRLTVTPAP